MKPCAQPQCYWHMGGVLYSKPLLLWVAPQAAQVSLEAVSVLLPPPPSPGLMFL